MKNNIAITCLVDTKTSGICCPEFGLSLLIEVYGKRLLFDTGAGNALVTNAGILGIDLETLDGIVLSHGHADHTGGLARLVPQCPVFAADKVTAPCFVCREDGLRHWISMPENSRQVLKNSQWNRISGFTEIMPGIFLTGMIPRNSDENTGGHFFTDDTCRIVHTVPEELSILLADGLLITGCCHAGLINTIECCKFHHPEIPIRVIAGGFHLAGVDAKRLERTIDYLRQLPLQKILFMHCTGEYAGAMMAEKLQCPVEWAKAGECYLF